MSKRPRTLDSFFSAPRLKRPRNEEASNANPPTQPVANPPTKAVETSQHPTYPFPIPHLPEDITSQLDFCPADQGRQINDHPDLDLIYYQPYLAPSISQAYFDFLRGELPFYRVQYSIKRGTVETQIHTPRYTTVFGVDETASFNPSGNVLIDAATRKMLAAASAYPTCRPQPIPQCLDRLRILTENATGCKFNFALVNYYSSGNDSISYHSDDERFLGREPAIASFTLGATRDFLLRQKKAPGEESSGKPIKLPLASGDMVLMRGRTQANWEHSIPKRKGPEAERGRINITFRRAMVKGGTANYYRYNVGDSPVFKWDKVGREMVLWKSL